MPIVTSYDYDAPINESGDATEKCAVIKAFTRPYVNLPDVPIPPPSTKSAFGQVGFSYDKLLLILFVIVVVEDNPTSKHS